MSGKLKQYRRRAAEHWENIGEIRRDLARFAAGALCLLLLAAGGFYFLREPFRQWRGRQALAQAEHYLKREDYRPALLALKRATVLVPRDPAIWRAVAAHLDRLGLPEALVAHENVLQLDPADTRQRLVLAKQALHFDNVKLAGETLAGLPEAAASGEEYHRIAATLALATGDDAAYAAQLCALLDVNPGDPLARFNLAVLDFGSGDPPREATARRVLVELLRAPEARLRAALELLKEAARRHDSAAAEQAAQVIDAALPDAAPGLPPGWPRLRAKLKAAAQSPEDAVLLARWLATIGLAGEALDWIERLPEKTRADAAVGDVAVILAARGDEAERLARWLSSGAWGQLPPRVVEQVVRSHRGAARDAWLQALVAANDSPPGLRALARLARIWNMPAAATQALEALLRLQPREAWAFRNLEEIHTTENRTAKLRELYGDWLRIAPDEPRVASRWWVLSAVLDQLPAQAEEGVLQFLAASGDAPAARIAAAAVYWRRGRPDAARAMLSGLSARARENPEAAFWLGVIAAEAGETGAAVPLRLAARQSWLPEENALLARASAKIAPRNTLK